MADKVFDKTQLLELPGLSYAVYRSFALGVGSFL